MTIRVVITWVCYCLRDCKTTFMYAHTHTCLTLYLWKHPKDMMHSVAFFELQSDPIFILTLHKNLRVWGPDKIITQSKKKKKLLSMMGFKPVLVLTALERHVHPYTHTQGGLRESKDKESNGDMTRQREWEGVRMGEARVAVSHP